MSAWCLLACMPYVAMRYGGDTRHRGAHILLARFLFGLPRAAAMWGVLLWHSVKARSILL